MQACPYRAARLINKNGNMAASHFLPLLGALLIGASLPLPTASAADAGNAVAVNIGVLAYKGSKEMTEDWAPLKDWLERSMPGHRFTLLDFDQATLTRSVREQTVDFVLTNSGHYVDLEHSDGISRIATLESPWSASPAQAIGSAIIVRRDARMQRLADLAGKRVQAVKPDAFGGYLVAVRELSAAGIDPERDISELQFVGFPMQQIVYAVRDGRADAGIVRSCMLEQMTERGDIGAGELRVLAPIAVPGLRCQSSSRLYPDWPFAALRHTPGDLAKQVSLALLSMPPSAEGYSWTVPGDYQSVDDLYRELKLGRYAYMREYSLAEMVRRYWGWMVFGFGLLAAWLAHTVRVEYLIGQRTRALRAAQEVRLSMEEDARRRQATLDHTARLAILGEMASAIAHELNQPLAAIRNFAHGIARRVNAGRMEAPPLLEGANEIATQSERAANIIRNIRGFARKNVPGQRIFDLVPVLEEAVSMFACAHPHARVIWKPGLEPQSACVMADPQQLQQVMLNLLKNALDAQQSIGRAREPIELQLDLDGASYRMKVRDHGCGVQPGHLERLCEPFFTTKPDGFGLGLSLSKNIVVACDGTLSAFANEDGKGLTLWFSLPVATTESCQ